MNTTNNNDIELFDSYLNGEMSDTERAQFEERVNSDEAFRKEFELHSQLVLGIQRKELKAMLQIQELQCSEELPAAASKSNSGSGRVISLFVKLAIAACFIGGVVFIGHDFWKLSSMGELYIAQLEAPIARGSGVEKNLSWIYDDLQRGNYSQAQENIDKARQLIQVEQSIAYPSEEETEYHQQILKLDTDELDWYQALLYAKTHKVFKAKKLLKQIAGSDSEYSDEAATMLN